MLAINGFFENGVFIPEKPLTAITVKGRLRAVLNIDGSGETAEESLARKQDAFRRFTRYCGVLPTDFDYKLELSEYRNERYGSYCNPQYYRFFSFADSCDFTWRFVAENVNYQNFPAIAHIGLAASCPRFKALGQTP